METRSRIINKASEFFGRLGINAVTNDDIAKSLGISKATIYKHFESKEGLVNIVVETELAAHFCRLSEIRSRARSAIEIIDKVSDYLQQVKNDTNANFFRDLKRSFDFANDLLRLFNYDLQKWIIQPAIKNGVSEGYFWEDTNEVLVSQMWLGLVEWQPITPGDWPHAKRHFIRGLLTEKGFRLYGARKDFRD